ncbi:TetR/AcrR family transcriptional regulator [Kribbella speibonae]|uniref:TetR/AcrR family transcriptional regulator n=1 Tax=Kribbella speibonae TaxID=1572660 RepID=A0A4R0J7H6_9ACTN|nr:TetR family transcriptional regulator [Kribbella speibonae]TCC16683.1 TetR/AcrR family transcriptional regulator [Kribbella speibonae]TCC41797.1 TetR/AcrR family transcriptional regulator [Kribbella speibonae]
MTFQRARRPEQRAERRRAILATAAAMLTEMPVADISLNELSRRVGLAKSNVLNYFDSREAVLLELSSSELSAWVQDLATALPDSSSETTDERADRLVATIVSTLAKRPVLCDLISTQAAVLERNITTETALAFKRAAAVSYEQMITVVVGVLPELGPEGAGRFIAAASLLAGSIWTHSHPVPAILAAYETDPALAAIRMEFEPALTDALRTLLYGALPRVTE